MEDYLSQISLYEDEKSVKDIVSKMNEKLISDICYYRTPDLLHVNIAYQSSRMKNITYVRIKQIPYNLIKLIFEPYKQLYPDIKFNHK
jgi:hypothetical protein